MPVERRGQVTGVEVGRSTGNGRNRPVLTEGGSLHAVARAGCIERFTSGICERLGVRFPGATRLGLLAWMGVLVCGVLGASPNTIFTTPRMSSKGSAKCGLHCSGLGLPAHSLET